MKYENTCGAVFLDRPNRFTAHVLLDGKIETVHVKNTGRCRELLVPGADVMLQRSNSLHRKTAFDLISVRKDPLGWVNLDSQACNAVAGEWLASGHSLFGEEIHVRAEYTFGNSRVDFLVEIPADAGSEGGRKSFGKVLMEVKGCTLEREKIGYFPDAPTERGTKHLKELTEALGEGYDSYLAFVIAMPGVEEVRANAETDPDFDAALKEAEKAGVGILYLCCRVSPDEIHVDHWSLKKRENRE